MDDLREYDQTCDVTGLPYSVIHYYIACRCRSLWVR